MTRCSLISNLVREANDYKTRVPAVSVLLFHDANIACHKVALLDELLQPFTQEASAAARRRVGDGIVVHAVGPLQPSC